MAGPSEPSAEGRAERVLNPLWIISLFLGLAEVTVGVAATQAHGWIQGMLAVFSVVFPSAVAVAFFGILLTRPFVLYAPRDYPNAPSIEAYVTAVSSAGRNFENFEAAVRMAVEEVVVPRLSPADQEKPEALIEAAVHAAREDFRRRSVEVDLSGIDPEMEVRTLAFPVDSVTVYSLLDTIYMSIADHVDPYSYGHQWFLHDPETGQTFREIGTLWRQTRGLPKKDQRGLEEVGIRPGSRLLAIRADRSSPRGCT